MAWTTRREGDGDVVDDVLVDGGEDDPRRMAATAYRGKW
jgi:hypothetical protein